MNGMVSGLVIHTDAIATGRLALKIVEKKAAITTCNPIVGVKATNTPIATPRLIAFGQPCNLINHKRPDDMTCQMYLCLCFFIDHNLLDQKE